MSRSYDTPCDKKEYLLSIFRSRVIDDHRPQSSGDQMHDEVDGDVALVITFHVLVVSLSGLKV